MAKEYSSPNTQLFVTQQLDWGLLDLVDRYVSEQFPGSESSASAYLKDGTVRVDSYSKLRDELDGEDPWSMAVYWNLSKKRGDTSIVLNHDRSGSSVTANSFSEASALGHGEALKKAVERETARREVTKAAIEGQSETNSTTVELSQPTLWQRARTDWLPAIIITIVATVVAGLIIAWILG